MQRSSPRSRWSDVPEPIRSAVETLLGSRVVAAESRAGGWSPGSADVLRLEDGRRAFAKAASAAVNAQTVEMHRREAAVLAALGDAEVAPRLGGAVESDGWIAVVVEHVDGRHPDPRSDADTDAVLDAVGRLPVPMPAAVPRATETVRDALEDGAADWTRLLAEGRSDVVEGGATAVRALADLAARAGDAVAADGLVHGDLRPDNVLIREDGTALLIDWPNALEGKPWFDALTYALDVRRLGGDADRALRHPVLAGVDPHGIDAVLAALAGYFLHRSLSPEPEGMAGIRAFQRLQGGVALDWIAERSHG
ncbi:phosphotransferase [Amnibacterium kyonggiense]|uniref:Phosphotransferase family enzyme n=1 Tax=Amnibacterium kyonggiense TaxID=595671 RepID=A0A4R7FQJ0_9MICO|nr:phosphotransferase [Amnibacterium kyonggiense]TDS80052.1 phosphotransferase family enzyme [Amnibacterium kyonggiense]